MLGGRTLVLAGATVFALTVSARAQTPYADAGRAVESALRTVAGKSSIDLIRLDGSMPGIPLRNSGVIPGSERVEFDGRLLKRGTDYAIDNPSGTIYLMQPVRAGQTLRVSYRYDATLKPSASKGLNLNGINGFKFDFQGGNSVMVGLGMAERAGDGSVIRSNLYGLRNSFSFGASGSGIKGVFAVGDRKRVQSHSLLDYNKDPETVEEGKSQAIVQNLQSSFLGGKATADLQDISSKFNGFQAFQSAGYTDSEIGQLGKERGLKRYGFGLQDVGGKGLKLSNSYRTVKDGKNTIEWRSLGFDTGTLSLNWKQQRVGKDFTRFNDLAEADRGQLAKETGLNREEIQGGTNFKTLKSNFQTLKVEDLDGSGINRRNFSLDYSGNKISFSDQRVEAGFTRFQSLREGDAGQLEREKGLRRQAIGLEFKPFGLALSFGQSYVKTDAGEESTSFAARDLKVAGKTWSFERTVRDTDAGFANLGNLTEGEIQGHMRTIASMYEPSPPGFQPQDKGKFLNGSGLRRSGERFQFGFAKGSNLMLDRATIRGKDDSGTVSRVFLSTPKLTISYRDQEFGENLAEIGTLMDFERARLGTLAGFSRKDWTASFNLDRNKQVQYSSLSASKVGEGDVSRQSFGYKDKGFEFKWANRSIGNDFASAAALVDPEKDLLAQLRGFSQSEFSIKWNAYRGLKVDISGTEALNATTEEQRRFRQSILSWDVDKYTRFDYFSLKQNSNMPEDLLFLNDIERFAFYRNLGKLGNFKYERETVDWDGSQTKAPDSRRETFAYETKLNSTTAVKTEQTHTAYNDGGHEDIRAHTLSTEINKKTGVSVTDLRIDRDGDKPDEKRRNYGFWWDFGRGMRLTYGYARQLNSTADGQMQSTFGLTPGQVGGLTVGAAAYANQRWDNQRYHSVGNVQVATRKPFDFGILKSVQLKYGVDTLRDNHQFQRENRAMGFSGSLGGVSLGWDYFSQINPKGERAIDRAFRMSSDPTNTKPFRANILYKIRTLPEDKQVMIRDFAITARPARGLEVTHQLTTNPERPRGDAILGSITDPTRVNKWKLDYIGSKSTKFGASWDEIINDQAGTRSRIGGVNLTLFANNPSPLHLYYGVEQMDQGDKRRTAHRYHLRFDQRPGPNQLFSMFVGNVSWQHSRADGDKIQNWSIRMEYQLRF